MNTAIKTIILNHLNSPQKASIKLSNLHSSTTKVELKLPFTLDATNSNYILLIKTLSNTYKINLETSSHSTYSIQDQVDLDKKISILIVLQQNESLKPVFWGGTHCQNQVECEGEVQPQTNNSKDVDFNQPQNNIDDLKNDNETLDFYNNESVETNNYNITPSTQKNNNINLSIQKDNLVNINDTNFNYFNENEKNINLSNNFNNIQDNLNFQSKNSINEKENNIFDYFCESQNNSQSTINNYNYFGNSQKPSSELFDYSDDEIENEIDQALRYPVSQSDDTSNCASCKYKQEFYQSQKMEEAKQALQAIAKMQSESNNILAENQTNKALVENQPNTLIQNANKRFQKDLETDNEQSTEYYDLIESQYDEMFSRYPIYSALSEIIPNSKWVKIEMADESYVLGLIYEQDKVKYMAYGVPQSHRTTPPTELADYSQWLPLDTLNPDGEGLWIMYQSAQTGETLKIEII